MKVEIISPKDARYLALHNQLLLGSKPGNLKKDLLNVIRQLGYIQIDTISIVERAHKHILWTRFPAYKNEMLDELIDKDKKVFEFWDHAAAYMPIEHFRYTNKRKQLYAERHKTWASKNKKLLNYIIDRIRNEGPLLSRDFDEPGKRGAWWDWKPAKDGLEFLFHTGKLVLRSRKNFQKVYDLPERFLPQNLETTVPTDEELSEHLIMKSIKANGFASEKEIIYLRQHSRQSTKKIIAKLIEEKKIIPIAIQKNENEIYYTTSEILKQLNTKKVNDIIHILSPFDNLIIQRKRLKSLFDFDFVIEFYLPASKRKFGYYCMPVLINDKFVCKIDAKADRKTGTFKIINIFPEGKKRLSSDSKKIIQEKLQQLAEFSGCKYLDFGIK